MTVATGAICTTLNAIWRRKPCADGWAKLLAHLGKTGPDDEPLPLTTILDSNGIDDAIWALRAVTGEDRRIRLFAVWCVRQVQHLLTDPRSLAALDMAERHANGLATDAELDAARDAARDAVFAAARVAAQSMVQSAAQSAASAASAAAEAAWVPAGDAVLLTARVAAQSAAWDAVDGVAECGARDEAYNAAGDAARDAQAAEFRRVFGGDA